MVEDPRTVRGPIRLIDGRVVVGIHVEADLRWLPFDGVDVKIVREVRVVR